MRQHKEKSLNEVSKKKKEDDVKNYYTTKSVAVIITSLHFYFKNKLKIKIFVFFLHGGYPSKHSKIQNHYSCCIENYCVTTIFFFFFSPLFFFHVPRFRLKIWMKVIGIFQFNVRNDFLTPHTELIYLR